MSLVSPIRKDMPAFLNIRPRIPLPGPQARRGSSGLFVLAGFFHGPLTFHITPHCLQYGTSDAANIISAMQKKRFPIKRFEVLANRVLARLALAVFRLLISVEMLRAGWISTHCCPEI